MKLIAKKWILSAGVFFTPALVFASPRPAAKPKPAKTTAKPAVPPGMMVAPFVLPPYEFMCSGIQPPIHRTTAIIRRNWRRGSVYLPKGSANVALHKAVTASDDFPIIGDLTLITNGEKGVQEGQWVELGAATQWVQIDLQNSFAIHGVLLWHYYCKTRVYRDVIIQLADNAAFTKNVRTVFNNDDDNTSGFGIGKDLEFIEDTQGQWIPIESQTARYVRLYSRGNTSDPQNQYIEVEVWATQEKAKSAPAAKPAKNTTKSTVPSGMMVAPFKLPPATYQ